MANWGQGPFEMRASGQFRTNADGSTSQLINQRIYNSDSTFTDQFAGWFDYNPSDGYIHYNDMAHANIRIRTAGDGLGDIVATGIKTSYCLIDIQHSNPGLPGSPGSSHYNTCGTVMQGISVGWNDVYGSGLNGQSVDVTGLPNGNYWLEDVADPLGAIQESNETNNATRIAITLSTLPTVGFRIRTSSPTGQSTGAVDHVHHFLQAIEKTVVPDTQERTAGDITNPGGFHHQDTGLRAGVALIPFEHLRRDNSILRRPPRHHGWHPGARLYQHLANANRRKPYTRLGLFGSWPMHWRKRVFFTDFLYWSASRLHGRGTCRSGSETLPCTRHGRIVCNWHVLLPYEKHGRCYAAAGRERSRFAGVSTPRSRAFRF
jgi:hypothetical protein